jgi:hypothetical protein
MEIPEERRSCKKEGMVKSCLVFGYDNGDGHVDALYSFFGGFYALCPQVRRTKLSGGGNSLNYQLVTPSRVTLIQAISEDETCECVSTPLTLRA